MTVSVMEVIDDADVGDGVVLFQILANRHHVLRFARPTAMIVDGELAADLRRSRDHGQQPLGRVLYLGFLGLSFVAGDHPNLGVQFMFLKQPEGLIVVSPEREVLDAMLLIGENLLFELGDMLATPVIGDLGEAHLGHHRRPLLRRALLIVERYDTPRRQVLLVVQWLSGRQSQQGKQEGAKQSHRG